MAKSGAGVSSIASWSSAFRDEGHSRLAIRQHRAGLDVEGSRDVFLSDLPESDEHRMGSPERRGDGSLRLLRWAHGCTCVLMCGLDNCVDINISKCMSTHDELPYETTLRVRDTCLCMHVQRAARAVARRYDEALRPLGPVSYTHLTLPTILLV